MLDDGFNGRALLTVTGGQVRISVRAAFPQFLMGQLSGEVRWLLETFWKGLEPVVKVPCRHPCPTPATGLFDLEVLMQAREEQRPEFPCSSCGKWLAIDPLLLGAEPLAAVGTTSQGEYLVK